MKTLCAREKEKSRRMQFTMGILLSKDKWNGRGMIVVVVKNYDDKIAMKIIKKNN
jgi:hypothetical protein